MAVHTRLKKKDFDRILSFYQIGDLIDFFQNNQDTNTLKFKRSIEVIYGLRYFIGNANKFAK